MRNTLHLSIALVIVQVLSACSSQKPPAGSTVNDSDASVPLSFANNWNLGVVAGNPGGMASIDGSALDARFFLIRGIARGGDKLYLADSNNVAIREYDLTTNQVTTLAGHLGSLDYAMLDGVGSDAYFSYPSSIAVLGSHLYVSDDGCMFSSSAMLRSIELSSGNVKTINDPATGVPWTTSGTCSLSLAATSDRLYVAGDEAIFEFDPETGTFERVIGAPDEPANIVDGDADTARFGSIGAISYNGSGGLYVMDNNDLRFVDLTKPEVKTLAGSDHVTSDAGVIQGYPGLADGTGEDAQFETVLSVYYDNSKVYMADTPASPVYMEKGPLAFAHQFGRLRTLDTDANTVDTFAGYLPRPTAIVGEADGPSDTARFIYPHAVYADGEYVYVGSYASLRRVSKTTGEVELVAGTLITSSLFRPGALALVDGKLYTFSRSQLQIMSIDPATGATSTVVGYDQNKFRTTNCAPIAGAGGKLYCAAFYIDPMTQKTTHRLYSVNLDNSNVNMVSSLLGKSITDMVSDGDGLMVLGRSGGALHLWHVDSNQDDTADDKGKVELESPYASSYARLAMNNGSAYVTDGTRIVRCNLVTGETERIAGSDQEAGCIDGLADEARFTQLSGIAAGPGGLFVADGMCHTVSFLSFDTGKVTQLAGSPTNMIFKVGQGSDAGINWPSRLVYDSNNQVLYISDSMDNVIGRLAPASK